MMRFLVEEDGQAAASSTTSVKKQRTKVPQSEWRCRVARYIPGSKKPPARSKDGKWLNVLIHVNEPLSPYVERDQNGHLLENVYQGAKIYEHVTKQRIAKHRFRPDDIVWEHPAEKHILSRKPLVVAPEYWAWRAKLAAAPYAVRYPNGFKGRGAAFGSLWPARETDVCDENNSVVAPDGTRYILLSYIEARKRVYCRLYANLVGGNSEFARLKKLLEQGECLQLYEVDGPSIDWPEPPFDVLTAESPGLDAHNLESVLQWLNNPKYSFGHGIVIAALLLHGTAWIDH